MIITTKPYGDLIYVAESRGSRKLRWSMVPVGASADDLRTISRDKSADRPPLCLPDPASS